MSVTFDTTTRAAYEAATTATAKAAAVVSSLTGTINVKVYNASNTVVGDGTMDSPWATSSLGTITIGEVTEFEVTTTGTPDSGWYIRFENSDASRWVRASFGLASSSQDFKWSLSNWEDGQTGTIGTATIICPGNEAPVFTAAPASANIASTGGTIQFTATDPDGGTVTYSLTTTRNGITINSTTGLVTVTAAAAGTTGNIVVLASDGILTASATCAVTVESAGGIKWNPGHWMFLQYGSSYDTQAERFAAYDHPSFRDNPNIKGVMLAVPWKFLETSKNVYATSTWVAEMTKLKSLTHSVTGAPMPKRLVLSILDQYYGAGSLANYAGRFPDYLYSENLLVYTSQTDIRVKMELTAALDRYIALSAAYAAVFESEPYFEMLRLTQETSYAYVGNVGTAYTNNLKSLVTAARGHWPTTNLFLPINWEPYSTSGQAALMEHCYQQKCGIGGTDTRPGSVTNGYSGVLGDVVARGLPGFQGDSAPVDQRGRTAIFYALEDTGTYRTDASWDYTGATAYNFVNSTMRASHMFWPRNTYSGRNDQRWFNAGTANAGGILQQIGGYQGITGTLLTNISVPSGY